MTTTPQPALTFVKPSEIATHFRNPRRSLGALDDLVASVKEHGILEPLVVAVWPESVKGKKAGKHLLIAGHRRLAAAAKAKLPQVPVIVRTDLDTEAKQLEAMLVENLHRADLTPVEEAEAYQTLLDFPGFTQTKVAKEVGQPVSRIRDRLKLTKLTPKVRDSLHDGQITIADALALNELEGDDKRLAAVLKTAGTSDFDYTLRQALRERDQERVHQAIAEAYTAAGYDVVKGKTYEPPKGWRSLQDLFTGYPYGFSPKDVAKQVEWAAKVHGDCPAKLAIDSGYSIALGCAKASAHKAAAPAKSKAELEREAKEKAAAKELQTNLAAAADARRAHLRTVVTETATLPLAKKRLIALVLRPTVNYEDEKMTRRRIDLLAEVLGVDLTDVADDDLDYALTQALVKLDVAGLVVVVDIAVHASYEVELASPVSYVGHGYGIDDWVCALGFDYGYQWSTFEADRFKGVLAPKPEGAEPGDAA